MMLQSRCAEAGFRLPVLAAEDLADIHTLVEIKHTH